MDKLVFNFRVCKAYLIIFIQFDRGIILKRRIKHVLSQLCMAT